MRGYSATISIVNVAKIKRMTEEYLDISWTRILLLEKSSFSGVSYLINM